MITNVKKHRKPLTDLEKQGRHRQFLTIHDTMRRLAPNNAVHNFFVGYQHKVLEQFDKAIEYLSRAVRIDPTYVEAYLSLSDSYRSRAKRARRKNDSDMLKAEHLLRIAYRLNPLHPQARSKLIDFFQETGQFILAELVRMGEPLPNMSQSLHLKSNIGDRAKKPEVNRDINYIRPRANY